MAEGRQIAVPTIQDFLGMHAHPGYISTSQPSYVDGMGGGPLGMMLRHMMENMTPLHGNPGDYLHPVCRRINEGSDT